jgi:hypothetical protein
MNTSGTIVLFGDDERIGLATLAVCCAVMPDLARLRLSQWD